MTMNLYVESKNVPHKKYSSKMLHIQPTCVSVGGWDFTATLELELGRLVLWAMTGPSSAPQLVLKAA